MEKIYYGTNDNQFGEWRVPSGNGPYPVAIIIHGGFWRSGFGHELMTDVAEDLTSKGWATWNIEYRRVGQEGGGWPGTFLDVSQACDHVKKLAENHSLNLDNVITIGHSAGGHLALWSAARHRLPASSDVRITDDPLRVSTGISLAGVNDLEKMYEVHQFRDQALSQEPNNPVQDLLGGPPIEVRGRIEQASPVELLPLGVNQILIHGSLDVHVPVGISDHYYMMAENYGDFIKYVELPDAEHFMLTDVRTKAWERISEEIELVKGL